MNFDKENKKVLLIDDDLAIRFVLRKIISRLFKSVEIFTSSDAVEGLGYIFLLKSEVVIIDTTLPSYGGLEVLDYISSNKKLKELNPKVIVLYRDPKYINTKLGYTFIYKNDYHFLDKLINALGEKLHFNNYLENSNFFNLLKVTGSGIIKFADKSDLALYNMLHGKNIFTKIINSTKWFVNQIIVSFYLAFFYIIGGRKVKELNISQNKVDLKKFRFKSYPTIAMSIAAILLILFQAGVFFGGFLSLKTTVFAASLTWDGGGTTNNWSDCANWTTDTCPVAADTVSFNSTSTKDNVIDASFGGTIAVVNSGNSYTGTTTMQRSLIVTSNFTHQGGNWNSGSNNLSIGGSAVMTGASFTAPSTTMTISSNLTLSPTTFSHNSGTITIDGSTASLSCGSKTFNLVTFNNSGTKTVGTDCSLPLGSNPTLAGAGSITLNGTLSGSGTLSKTSGTLTMNNVASTLSGFTGLNVFGYSHIAPTTSYVGYSPFVVNDTFTLAGGSITLPSTADLNNNLTISAGTFNAPSGTMTLANALTITGTPTFNANGGTVTFDGNSSATLSCNSITFNLVTFAHTAGTKTVSSNCSMPLGNNPTLANSVVLIGTLSGTGTLTESGGTLNLSTGAVLSGFTGLSVSGFTVSGATANFGGYSSFVMPNAGTVTVTSGTLTLPNGSDLNGGLTISGGTFNAPSGTMTIAGALTISGTPIFNHNNGTITFDGSSGGTLSCNNVTFNLVTFANTGGDKVVNNNCTMPLGNNPTMSRGLILNGILSGTGTLTVTANSFSINAGGSISGFTGLSAPIFTISGATADYSSFTSFVTTNLTVSSGSLSLPNGADINGTLIISGGTFNAPSGTMTVASALTVTGSPTFNHNNGTITFDGNIGGVLSCGNITFNLVNLSHTSGTRTVNSNCTLPLGNNPILGTASGSTGVTNNGTLTGTGTLNTGVFNFNTGSTLTGFSGINANSTFTVAGGTANFSGYTSFVATSNAPVAISSGSLTLPNGSDLNNSLTISGGTFTAPSGNMSVAAGLTISGSPTFNHNNGTVTFDGSTATLSCNNVTFNSVVINFDTGTKTINSNCTLPLGNNPTITSANGAAVTLNGTLTGAGTVTYANGTLTLNTGAVMSGFNGVSIRAMTVAGATANFGSYSSFAITSTSLALTLSSGSLTLPSGADLNNLIISGGTFNAPSGSMTVAGDLTISGSPTFNNSGGTITFDGGSATLACNNVTFNLVTFAHTSGIKTINSNCSLPLGNNPNIPSAQITLNGTISGTGTITTPVGPHRFNAGAVISGFSGIASGSFTVQGATLNFSSYTTFDINGNFTVSSGSFTAPSGTMSVQNNFTFSGGTFNHNNGTVVLDGTNQTVIGTTFYNLTKTVTSAATLTITAGNTETILNTLTLKGTSGNLLSLVSSSPGSQWNIDPQGTRDIQYLSVTDSNNINASAIQTLGLNITNGGNNTNWNFNYPVVVFNNFNDGSTTTDNTPTINFNITDPDASNTVKYQIQIDNNSDFSSPEVDSTSSLNAQGDFSFTPSTALSDGEYYLRIKGTDNTTGTTGFTTANSGNVAFKIDTTAPTGKLYIGFGTNTGNDHDVYLIFNATDNLSGVKEMIYSESSNFSGASYINYQTAKIFRLSDGYGRKVVYVKYKDYAGNESPLYSAGVTLENHTTDTDNQNPNNTPVSPPSNNPTSYPTNNLVEVALFLTDADDNPIKNTKVTIDGVEALTDNFGVAIFNSVTQGDHKIIGSVNGASFEQTINIDANTKVYKVVIEEKGNKDLIILLLCSVIVILIILFIMFIVAFKKHKKENGRK